jgi:hypothetical protein
VLGREALDINSAKARKPIDGTHKRIFAVQKVLQDKRSAKINRPLFIIPKTSKWFE